MAVEATRDAERAAVLEKPIWFESEGRELFGMLHRPNARRPRAVVVVVDSHLEYRLGPHRFYVRAARHWAERGFAVLRFDHPGNGESPGDEQYPHIDSFPIRPTVDAVDVARERTGAGDAVLAGLCKGARNALYAAAAVPDVRHLLAFGMPLTDVARTAFTDYLSRALDPRAWLRLLRGQSDLIRRILPAALGIGRNRIFAEPVYRSLSTLISRDARILFLFGRGDIFLPDFEEHFELFRARLTGMAERCEVELLADANHTFSRVSWQDAAIAASTAWLEGRFAASAEGLR